MIGRTNSTSFKSTARTIEDIATGMLATSHLKSNNLAALEFLKTTLSCSMLTCWAKQFQSMAGFKFCFKPSLDQLLL